MIGSAGAGAQVQAFRHCRLFSINCTGVMAEWLMQHLTLELCRMSSNPGTVTDDVGMLQCFTLHEERAGGAQSGQPAYGATQVWMHQRSSGLSVVHLPGADELMTS